MPPPESLWQPDHHHYVRKTLALLKTISSCANCPPEGHAFLSILSTIESFLQSELPRHILEEEIRLFPQFVGEVDPGVLHTLREEHLAITELAAEFSGWLAKLLKHPNDADWRVFRDYASRLEALLSAHLQLEERALPHAFRTIV